MAEAKGEGEGEGEGVGGDDKQPRHSIVQRSNLFEDDDEDDDGAGAFTLSGVIPMRGAEEADEGDVFASRTPFGAAAAADKDKDKDKEKEKKKKKGTGRNRPVSCSTAQLPTATTTQKTAAGLRGAGREWGAICEGRAEPVLVLGGYLLYVWR